jgi:NAD(P)-dependent dehydrogenase (short-subunit alcohol dehydrogenase family)
MLVRDKNVLITGAGRGLGTALVREALDRGARKVYAAARRWNTADHWNDSRVVAVAIDITDGRTVEVAARDAQDTDILINNAGVLTRGHLLELSEAELRRDMETNFYGTLRVIRAFAPLLDRRPEAAIVNLLSIASLAGMPTVDTYSASKAALHSATQSLRAELVDRGISVFAVFPGPIDTDVGECVPSTKTSAKVVAANIFDGIDADLDDIFPDEVSRAIGEQWLEDPKAVEMRFASMTV